MSSTTTPPKPANCNDEKMNWKEFITTVDKMKLEVIEIERRFVIFSDLSTKRNVCDNSLI
jgi:hypothetical protein